MVYIENSRTYLFRKTATGHGKQQMLYDEVSEILHHVLEQSVWSTHVHDESIGKSKVIFRSEDKRLLPILIVRSVVSPSPLSFLKKILLFPSKPKLGRGAPQRNEHDHSTKLVVA